jgi:hypothetical protein
MRLAEDRVLWQTLLLSVLKPRVLLPQKYVWFVIVVIPME